MDLPKYSSVENILEDVRAMRPRGGSAFGYCAATAYKLIAENTSIMELDTLFGELEQVSKELLSEKPTMATIHNAKSLIVDNTRTLDGESGLDNVRLCIIKRADLFIDRSSIALDRIGEFGGNLIQDGETIMIHSYSRSLMSCFAHAHKSGKSFAVICTDSQPTTESRWAIHDLTSWGIETTFVLDAGMAMIMSEADWCLTGADSISNIGSVANKIGTYQLALLAQKHEKPLYIATEIMKLQTDTIEGYPIHLERRSADEILDITSGFDFPDLIKVVHQFFDLTPARYVRGLITEQGIISPETICMAWNKFESMFDGMSQL